MDFNDSIIESVTLGFLLMIPCQLQSLRYSIFTGSTSSYESFVPAKIYGGLCSQKHSLSELFITREEWWGHGFGDNWFLGSLSSFQRLKHLKLPAAALIELKNDDDDDDDDDDNNNNEETPALTVRSSHNPLDNLLPPSIITIELDIGGMAFSESAREDFLMKTGVPYTLLSTSQHLPELRTFDLINCKPHAMAQPSDAMSFWSDKVMWSTGHNITFKMID